MNGELVQLIALTCQANAALAGHGHAIVPDPVAYRFCRSVSFVMFRKDASGTWREELVAQTPDAWIDGLARAGASHVTLTPGSPDDEQIPARIGASFANGGGWALDVNLPDDIQQRWIARWDVAEPEAADQKIWRVTYGCVATFTGAPRQASDLAGANARLERALVDIRSFAERIGHLENFVETFDTALKCLRAPPGRPAYPLDPAMRILAPPAANLLQAAECAYVFGGMGSWNDMGFEGETEIDYQRVSDELYVAINEAIAAAASAPAAR